MIYYKKIRDYFNKIIAVETPAKFTINFLQDVMLYKGSNDRNLIALLKSMGFLDDRGNPTQLYSDYKITDLSKTTMAKGIRNAYGEIYRRNKDFDKLDEEQTKSYIKSITRLGDDSSILPLIAKTFMNLKELADFTHNETTVPIGQGLVIANKGNDTNQEEDTKSPIKLNYKIEINLPSAASQETYDKIFDSIKRVLLNK